MHDYKNINIEIKHNKIYVHEISYCMLLRI